jgi:GntR family transcriptional regulator
MAINEPESRYRQLADLLREKINSGEYPRGTRMPSEPELAKRYNVGQATANRAMSILRAEGLVRAERGKGTIVHEIPPIPRESIRRYGRAERELGESRGAYDTEIRRLGYEPGVEMLELGMAAAPPRVAELLQVPQGGETVLIRKRKMLANNIATQIAVSYFPREIAEGTQLEQVDTGIGGSKSRLAELGFEQVNARESITVRRSTSEEQALLRLTEDQSVMEILHVARTEEGRAVEVTIHTMPTHQWVLNYEWVSDAPSK